MAAVRRPNMHLQQAVNVWFWPGNQHTGHRPLIIIILAVAESTVFGEKIKITTKISPWQTLLQKIKKSSENNHPCSCGLPCVTTSCIPSPTETYAMMVLITMSLIFSHIKVVLIPLEPRYCHKAFKALKTHKDTICWSYGTHMQRIYTAC